MPDGSKVCRGGNEQVAAASAAIYLLTPQDKRGQTLSTVQPNRYVSAINNMNRRLLRGEGSSFVPTSSQLRLCDCDQVYIFAFCAFLCNAVHVCFVGMYGIAIIGMSEDFTFSTVQKGFILGGFSTGYLAGQIPCGLYVNKYGGYWGPIYANIVSCVIFVSLPYFLALGNDNESVACIFSVSLFVVGVFNSLFLPSFHALIANNIDKCNQNTIHNVVYSGQQFGGIAATFGIDSMIQIFGWKTSFQIIGGVAGLVGIAWKVSLSQNFFLPNPEGVDNDSNYIGRLDMEENENNTDSVHKGNINIAVLERNELNDQKRQWQHVMKSRPFWVACINHFGVNYFWYVFINWAPL